MFGRSTSAPGVEVGLRGDVLVAPGCLALAHLQVAAQRVCLVLVVPRLGVGVQLGDRIAVGWLLHRHPNERRIGTFFFEDGR